MLRSVDSIKNYSLQATDGEIGSLRDTFFDEQSWNVRYFVVDTGRWLGGRRVLISPVAISGAPDWKARTIPVRLDKRQVEDSPDIETHKPISRLKEEELALHYNWPVYWGGYIAAAPIGAETAGSYQQEAASRTSALRSCDEVREYGISAADGDIGHVEDFIMDDESWAIRYLVVDTRNWLPGKKVLISPSWVREIRWNDRSVFLDLRQEEVRNSPEYRRDVGINREMEIRLYDYYGRPKYWNEDRPAARL